MLSWGRSPSSIHFPSLPARRKNPRTPATPHWANGASFKHNFSTPSSGRVKQQQDVDGHAPPCFKGPGVRATSSSSARCRGSTGRAAGWRNPRLWRDLGRLHGGCSLLTFPSGSTSQTDLDPHTASCRQRIPPFTKSQGLWAMSMLDRKPESGASGEARHALRNNWSLMTHSGHSDVYTKQERFNFTASNSQGQPRDTHSIPGTLQGIEPSLHLLMPQFP